MPAARLLLCSLLAVVCLLGIGGQADANESAKNATPGHRPKIGLVLSGGGARGFAHVGVLKVLEELHIPIDYVAGTSMGAIVGGLYASGMSPEEIEERIVKVDWARILTDTPPREEVSLRRKEFDTRFPLKLELGVRDGAVLMPRGALSGVSLELMLRELTSYAFGITHFDQLPIPFRAVATNMETGQMVVFDRGPLHQAIRASMSVPGMFAPTEVDGWLLGDGGLVKNLPVDLARSMGADVVIAVNIGTSLAPRSELNSVLGLTQQMITILTEQNVQQQLELLVPERDVLIAPNLGTLTFADFSRGEEAIASGQKAARNMVPALRRLALSQPDYLAVQANRNRLRSPRVDRIDFVEIRRTEITSPDTIKATMNTQPGSHFNLKELHQDLRKVFARGDFEHVDYRLDRREGKTGVLIDLSEKSWGPNFLRFGLTASTDFQGEGSFQLTAAHTRTWVNSLGAEWRNELEIGRNQRLSTEFYQPLSHRAWTFVAPYSTLEQQHIDLYDSDTQKIGVRYRASFARTGADVGVNIGPWAELRVGAGKAKVEAKPAIPAGPPFPDYHASDTYLSARAIYDQLDNAALPRFGSRFEFNWLGARHALGGEYRYDRLAASFEQAMSFGRNTFAYQLRGGGFGREQQTPGYNDFALGGFQQLSGLRPGQLRGSYSLFGRLAYYRDIGGLPGPLGARVYAGATLEAGNVWNRREDVSLSNIKYSTSAFLAADTALGPFFFAYGRGSQDSSTWYLFLGRP